MKAWVAILLVVVVATILLVSTCNIRQTICNFCVGTSDTVWIPHVIPPTEPVTTIFDAPEPISVQPAVVHPAVITIAETRGVDIRVDTLWLQSLCDSVRTYENIIDDSLVRIVAVSEVLGMMLSEAITYNLKERVVLVPHVTHTIYRNNSYVGIIAGKNEVVPFAAWSGKRIMAGAGYSLFNDNGVDNNLRLMFAYSLKPK